MASGTELTVIEGIRPIRHVEVVMQRWDRSLWNRSRSGMNIGPVQVEDVIHTDGMARGTNKEDTEHVVCNGSAVTGGATIYYRGLPVRRGARERVVQTWKSSIS